LNIIETQNLCFEYRTYNEEGEVTNSVPVLRGIDFSVKEGEFVAVLGHNGSGKSTLAKHFNVILSPTSGRITVDGIDAADENKIFDIRSTVGMVFQNPDNQIVATIVEEDVAFALENLGVPANEIRRRIDEAMKIVDIYKFRKHAPHQLSGGQKQRVAIAGVIAMAPKCIVLDEPTAMLDPKGRKEVMETIHSLNRERGITIILITHYMEEAASAGRVVVMEKGLIVMDGTPKQIFSNADKLKKIGLDVPPAAELAQELIRRDVKLPKDIITGEELVKELAKILPPVQIDGDIEPETTENTADNVIKTENLYYKYSVGTPFEVTAIKDVNFTVKKGEFIGIIGHTGSGKSTLIQHLNGLLKQTSGNVIINGRNIWNKNVNIKDIRFEAGLVFQYSEYQLFEETVFKDIAFGPRNMGLSEDEITERVLSAAKAMGVHESWLKTSPFDLSGGQKRRVALAGVIAMQPKILILDEPAAGLDPHGRDTVLNKINEYHRNSGTTVLLVSHSMEDIVKYTEKVLVMNGGEIFLFLPANKVFRKAKEITGIGLDIPQIAKITEMLKDKGLNLGTDVYTVEKAVNKIIKCLKI
jgi:energy-coupling factor transport system ATP-binding protein